MDRYCTTDNAKTSAFPPVQAGMGALPKRPLNEIETAAEVLNAVSQLAARVEMLAERLCGSTPETQGLTAGPEYPSGVFPRLGFDALHARGRIADATRALGRIEDSLP